MTRETLMVLLDIVNSMSVPIALPDAEIKTAALIKAKIELEAQLTALDAE